MSLLGPNLDAFMAVVAHKTVHAAAEGLCITQTATTQRIRNLEQRLKTTLFVRSRRGMQPTPEGEALLQYCKSAGMLEGELYAKLHHEDAGCVNVTVLGQTSIMRSRVIPSCTQTMKDFPQLLLHFRIEDRQDPHLILKQGACELAILTPEQMTAEMEHKPLAPEEYVLVCSKDWAKRSLKDIIQTERIIDFDPQDTLTFNYLKHYSLYDGASPERYFVNDTEEVAELVGQGLGYSVFTREFFHVFNEEKHLMMLNGKKTYSHPISLCYYPRPVLPAYFQSVVDAIK
jgi:LysR family transcriptional regulator, chromosome initiation inhibitor